MNDGKKYTVAQMAKKLNISRATVMDYCKRGRIKAERISLTRGRWQGKFTYVIEEEDFVQLKAMPKLKTGPKENTDIIGNYKITRLKNGELLTEKV
jgi:predicted transcriptional regulator